MCTKFINLESVKRNTNFKEMLNTLAKSEFETTIMKYLRDSLV